MGGRPSVIGQASHAGTPKATDVLDAAAAEVVAELQQIWISRTGAENYLPDLLATALRNASGADAGLVFASQHTTRELLAQATAGVRRSKPAAAVDGVRLARLAEGRCAQALHIGPYREEPTTIGRLHAFIREQGCAMAGRHHEIYLSDPSRTAPETLRTIFRDPWPEPIRNGPPPGYGQDFWSPAYCVVRLR